MVIGPHRVRVGAGVEQIAADEFGQPRAGGRLAIDADHRVAARGEARSEQAADVTRGTGEDDALVHVTPRRRKTVV